MLYLLVVRIHIHYRFLVQLLTQLNHNKTHKPFHTPFLDSNSAAHAAAELAFIPFHGSNLAAYVAGSVPTTKPNPFGPSLAAHVAGPVPPPLPKLPKGTGSNLAAYVAGSAPTP